MTDQGFETFWGAFIDCALWCATNESLSTCGVDDIDQTDLDALKQICLGFFMRNKDLFQALEGQAGHDFYLTINGFGCGFWDGGWSEPSATILTRECKFYPEVSLYRDKEDSTSKLYVFME